MANTIAAVAPAITMSGAWNVQAHGRLNTIAAIAPLITMTGAWSVNAHVDNPFNVAAIAPAIAMTGTFAVAADCRVVRPLRRPNPRVYDTRGRLLPATADPVVPFSCWLTHLILTNTHSSALTVTVADRQTTPAVLIDAKSLAASETYILDCGPDGIYMQGGITWLAGTAALVSGFMTVKK